MGRKFQLDILNGWVRVVNHNRMQYNVASRMVCLDVVPKYDHADMEVCSFTVWENLVEETPLDLGSAQLIFVPAMMHEHFFAIVVNLMERKVQYIDSLTHPHILDEWMGAVKSLQKLLSKFLIRRGHPNGREVERYEITTVKGSWRADVGNKECGVYAMHQMRWYDGQEAIEHPRLMESVLRDEL